MVEKINGLFFEVDEIIIKVYSMEYKIYKKGNYFIIYPIIYSDRKEKYRSLDDLFNNFKIYNEKLADISNRIEVIKK